MEIVSERGKTQKFITNAQTFSSPRRSVLSVKLLFYVGRDVLWKANRAKEALDSASPHTIITDKRIDASVSKMVVPPTQKHRHGFSTYIYLPTFSMLYSDSALDAISTASCCIWSPMSAFLIIAFRCSLMADGWFENDGRVRQSTAREQ